MALKQICAALVLTAGLAPLASAEDFRVKAAETAVLKLTQPAESVVIGNAAIADISVHDPMTLLVTGKAFGSTNVLVLDRSGRTIYSNQIVVAGGGSDQLTIVRGAGTATYSCVDKCRPTPVVGDNTEYFSNVMQNVQSMQGAARGGAR